MIIGAALLVPPLAAAAQFSQPGEPVFDANEGVVNLAWETDVIGATFELQQSPSPLFPEAETRTRYQGPDPGSMISGLPKGSHHFRIRHTSVDGAPGEWSTPVEVRVEYIATKWVVTLLICGAIIFIATVAAIITGHLRTRQAPAAS